PRQARPADGHAADRPGRLRAPTPFAPGPAAGRSPRDRVVRPRAVADPARRPLPRPLASTAGQLCVRPARRRAPAAGHPRRDGARSPRAVAAARSTSKLLARRATRRSAYTHYRTCVLVVGGILLSFQRFPPPQGPLWWNLFWPSAANERASGRREAVPPQWEDSRSAVARQVK